MSMILIKNFTEETDIKLRAFKKIYLEAFPNPDEREDFENIMQRIFSKSDTKLQTFCVLSLDENETVNGGLITDWYKSCGALEIIYIATAPNCRRTGIGTSLRYEGIELIKDTIGQPVKRIFIEIDIPSLTNSKCSFNPYARLKVWSKWGAKQIPFKYYQPPLGYGKGYVEGMMLASLPVERHETETNSYISTEELKQFLRSFYKGLNAENSKFLSQMENEIDSISQNGKLKIEKL